MASGDIVLEVGDLLVAGVEADAATNSNYVYQTYTFGFYSFQGDVNNPDVAVSPVSVPVRVDSTGVVPYSLLVDPAKKYKITITEV